MKRCQGKIILFLFFPFSVRSLPKVFFGVLLFPPSGSSFFTTIFCISRIALNQKTVIPDLFFIFFFLLKIVQNKNLKKYQKLIRFESKEIRIFFKKGISFPGKN